MKRLFATLGLLQLFFIFTSVPIASAYDTLQLGICNFGYAPSIDFSKLSDSEKSDKKNTLKAKKEALENAYNDVYYESFKDDPEYVPDPNADEESDTGANQIPDDAWCGKKNPATGFVERGDCTSQVISEVSEVVNSATPITEGSSSNDKIVNLYHGVCCFIYEGSFCYETRTYYTETLDDCVAAAQGDGVVKGGDPNCELRQWIIASTGMALLKLYVKQIFTFGAFAVGAIAVATIILNGIRISVAGVSGDISEAKQKITQSLSGIVLLFLAALILYSINPDFFGG